MTDSITNRTETRTATLLIGISFPDVDPETDPEAVADVVVGVLNEDRVRNGGVDSALDDDAGFDRPEVEPVMVSAIPPAQWMTSETLTRLRHSEELRIAAEEQLAAAHDVIRRLRDGWTVIRTTAPWGREWHGPDGELEAVSAAQAAVLDAVAGPNDPPERTVLAMVAGRSFACETCSANVFVEITEPGDLKPRYRCNGCGAEYEGTWPPAADPDDTEENRDG